MTAATDPQEYVHVWQDKGIGKAPFAYVYTISLPSRSLGEHNPEAYNSQMRGSNEEAKQFGVTLCTCYVCGMSLIHNCIICDADGKHFVVGSDCVRKTGDSQLMSKVDAAERTRLANIRAAKREEKQRQRVAEYQTKLDKERQANGGLTNAEIAENARNEKA